MLVNQKTLLDAIDEQVDFLLSTRSVFPYMSKPAIGQSIFETAPFYRKKGYDVRFDFGKRLTADDVVRIRAIGHWINQNFVVRLCALLEGSGVIPRDGQGKIQQDLSGSDEVDILRRLRNQFAHGAGRYNPNVQKQKTLYKRIVSHFSVDLAEDPEKATDYPLSIDVVLDPLVEGCKRYIKSM